MRAYPTFIVTLDGVEIDRMEGADERRLREMVANGVAAWRSRPAPQRPAGLAAAVGATRVGRALLGAGVEVNRDVAAAVAAALREAALLPRARSSGT